jgi:hypothetical protein
VLFKFQHSPLAFPRPTGVSHFRGLGGVVQQNFSSLWSEENFLPPEVQAPLSSALGPSLYTPSLTAGHSRRASCLLTSAVQLSPPHSGLYLSKLLHTSLWAIWLPSHIFRPCQGHPWPLAAPVNPVTAHLHPRSSSPSSAPLTGSASAGFWNPLCGLCLLLNAPIFPMCPCVPVRQGHSCLSLMVPQSPPSPTSDPLSKCPISWNCCPSKPAYNSSALFCTPVLAHLENLLPVLFLILSASHGTHPLMKHGCCPVSPALYHPSDDSAPGAPPAHLPSPPAGVDSSIVGTGGWGRSALYTELTLVPWILSNSCRTIRAAHV